MKVKRQIITVEELLSRYAAGERDFTYVAIDDLRLGMPNGGCRLPCWRHRNELHFQPEAENEVWKERVLNLS
ncbi:hypothetical protein [Nostoc sp.]|uniref:hypothetical protein n=1 Tax=Nostoc sp. TaxID=1180 RepID=UPI002FF7B4AE